MKHATVVVHDLTFRYPDQREDTLRGITFEVKQGDFAGLIGPNGSGKTTLVKLMLGILPITSGSVELFGTHIHHLKDWSRIGYVPQNVVGFDRNFPANVEEIVRMGLVNQTLSRDEREERIRKSLGDVGMAEHRQARLTMLSAGQQQRVLIARALASNPELLILDEPTAEVDMRAQKAFYELLRKLNKERNMTIILVTHDIGMITKMANRIICVNKTLLCYGSPTQTSKKIEKLFSEQYVIAHHHD